MAGAKGKSIHNGVKGGKGKNHGPKVGVSGHLSETYSSTIVMGQPRGRGEKA